MLRWLERLDDRHPGILAVGYLMFWCAVAVIGIHLSGRQ